MTESRERLLELYAAFYWQMQSFTIVPHFDPRGTYAERKARELERLKRQHRQEIRELTKQETMG